MCPGAGGDLWLLSVGGRVLCGALNPLKKGSDGKRESAKRKKVDDEGTHTTGAKTSSQKYSSLWSSHPSRPHTAD